MTVTETETIFVWFLVGDVILIYVAAYAFDFIANKVWFWFGDRRLLAPVKEPATHDDSDRHQCLRWQE